LNGERAVNGFVALAELDTNGDGVVDSDDPMFRRLAVWKDVDRNGVSAAGELLPLARVGIKGLSLSFEESRRKDRWGNEYRYRTAIYLNSGQRRFAWDVFFPVR
jgi:hypothetical protein